MPKLAVFIAPALVALLLASACGLGGGAYSTVMLISSLNSLPARAFLS